MIRISSSEITKRVAELFIRANTRIREEVFDVWIQAMKREAEGSLAREVFGVMIKNAWIAWKEHMPICQDT